MVLKTNSGGAWLIPQVEALLQRGHEVTVIIPPGPGRLRTALDARGIVVLESPFSFTFDPSPRTLVGLLRLRRALRRIGPDVIFYHLYASALAARLASLGLGARRVHMIAGPLYLDSPVVKALETALLRLDHTIVAGSDHTRDRYLALGASRSRLRSIPYGADTSTHSPIRRDEREAARVRLGLRQGQFVAVIVAYFYAPKSLVTHGSGIKGHDILLEAWATAFGDDSTATLMIVGSGFDEPGAAYREELMARKWSSNVIWVETVPSVRDFYAAADVSVSPSLSENHGAAVEAGALGLPSIVSDAGGLPETLVAGAGWVVPAGDPGQLVVALQQAREAFDAGRLAAMGQDARKHISANFDAHTAAARVADEIEATALARATPGLPRVTVVTEARFDRGSDGVWVATDGVNGDTQWRRYVGAIPRLGVAGRATYDGTANGDPVSLVEVTPLTTYRGLAQMVAGVPRLASELSRLIRASDLLVLRAPGPLSLLTAGLCRLQRRPYAVEAVGDPEAVLLALVPGRRGAIIAALSRKSMQWTVRGAAAARYVTRDTLQRKYPTSPGVPSHSVPNVVLRDADFVEAGRAHGPARPAEILLVGSQENRYKGHDVALRALHLLRARGIAATMTLVGRGPERIPLESLASSLGLQDAVTFVDHVDRADLHRLMDRADVLAHPSRTEGLPRVVLEAMARGLPVVATAVGGVPEIVPEEFLCSSEDAGALAEKLGRLLGDSNLYQRASAGSLERAKPYAARFCDQAFDTWTTLLAALGAR